VITNGAVDKGQRLFAAAKPNIAVAPYVPQSLACAAFLRRIG